MQSVWCTVYGRPLPWTTARKRSRFFRRVHVVAWRRGRGSSASRGRPVHAVRTRSWRAQLVVCAPRRVACFCSFQGRSGFVLRHVAEGGVSSMCSSGDFVRSSSRTVRSLPHVRLWSQRTAAQHPLVQSRAGASGREWFRLRSGCGCASVQRSSRSCTSWFSERMVTAEWLEFRTGWGSFYFR